MTIEDELHALERARCDAIGAGDVATLQTLLSDDYIHVHMTGHVDDRAGHLAAVSARPRRTERGALTIRVYGALAVLTGPQTNHMTTASGETRAVQAYCHQVAARTGAGWRFVSVQLTPIAAR